MITKVVFSVVFFHLVFSLYNCEEILVEVNDYSNTKQYCMTNSSYGIIWNNSINAIHLNDRSIFIPRFPQNSYLNDDFNLYLRRRYSSNETQVWNSLILDRRWEALDVLKTYNEKINATFVSKSTILEVSFSLRTDKDAHVYLCDGSSVFSSNCYWLQLESDNGTTVAIRKCHKGEISLSDKPPSNLCQKILKREKHPSKYLALSSWSHFSILKCDNKVQLLLRENEDNLLTFHDRGRHISVRNVFVESKNTNAFWKFHQIKPHIVIKEELEKILFGPPVPVTDGSVCISFFVLMGATCSITLAIADGNNHQNIIKEKTFFGLKNNNCAYNKWHEIKFFAEDIKSNEVVFFMSTYCKFSSPYFVIDSSRLCQHNELRMITSEEPALCQTISNKNLKLTSRQGKTELYEYLQLPNNIRLKTKITILNPNRLISDLKNTCPENTFSRYCIPCLWLPSEKCARLKICEKYVNGVECLCSAGYTGANCQSVCQKGYYGHSCQKQCEHCDSNLCDYINGECIDKPLWCPEVSQGEIPIIHNITLYKTSLEIIFQSRPSGDDTLQINITAICLSSWCQKNVTKTSIFNRCWMVLKNLLPFTRYMIKISFYRGSYQDTGKNKNLSVQTQPTIPKAPEDVSVYSKNESSISLRWKPPYPPTGIVEMYKIDCKVSTGRKIASKNLSNSPCDLWPEYQCWTITNLKKNYSYNIVVSSKNKNIDTLGPSTQIWALSETEPPEAPYDLKTVWSDTNDLSIYWKHPNRSNGIIQFFNISIIEESLEGTNTFSKTVYIKEGRYKLIYICNVEARILQPSTIYTVTVSGYNGYYGSEAKIRDSSPPSVPKFEIQPKISIHNDTIKVEIPKKVKDLNDDVNSVKLLIFIHKSQLFVDTNLEDFQKTNANHVSALVCNISEEMEINLTFDNKENTHCQNSLNFSVEKNTCYNVTLEICTYMYDRLIAQILAPSAVLASLIIFGFAFRTKFRKRKSNTLNQKVTATLNEYSNNSDRKQRKSKLVKIVKFEEYIKNALNSGELIRQHQEILNSGEKTYERIYESLLLDYIDATFTDDYTIRNAYLTAKVPKENEIDRFWKLICHENISTIVFFGNGTKSTVNYWPQENDILQYDNNMSIKSVFYREYVDYEERKLIVRYKDEERDMYHFRISVPFEDDFDISPLSYLPLCQKISRIPLSSKSPILIHSSATMQEIGLALLCDICIRNAERNNTVDIVRVCENLFNCEPALVSKTEYYILTYLILLENFLQVDPINCSSFSTKMPILYSEKDMKKYLHYIKETTWLDEINLKHLVKEDEKSSLSTNLVDFFHNFCKVDGFRPSQTFLVTEEPSAENLVEFWEFIVRKNISVMVLLNPSSIVQLSQRKLTETLSLRYQEIKKFKYYEWITMEMVTPSEKTNRVETFLLRNWASLSTQPDNMSDFVNFCIETNKIVKSSKFVLVTCWDGFGASGLYLAMLHSIDKIQKEGVCDVCSAVRKVRRCYKEFLKHEEQHLFLLEAAECYLKETQLYERR